MTARIYNASCICLLHFAMWPLFCPQLQSFMFSFDTHTNSLTFEDDEIPLTTDLISDFTVLMLIMVCVCVWYVCVCVYVCGMCVYVLQGNVHAESEIKTPFEIILDFVSFAFKQLNYVASNVFDM